jgi:hypothetical protein
MLIYSVVLTPSGYSQDVLSTDFFTFTETIRGPKGGGGCSGDTVGGAMTSCDTSKFLLNTTDRFAKLLYSLILSDLGQSIPSNILAHPSLLMDFVNLTETDDGWYFYDISDYLHLTQTTGLDIPPVYPATILTSYLCQVPVRKSISSLIISILVADLVFLQALWKTLNWVVTFGLERRHPDARYCIGCAKQLSHNEGYQLVDRAMSPSLRSRESCAHDTDALERHATVSDVQVGSEESQEESVRRRSLAEPPQEALP